MRAHLLRAVDMIIVLLNTIIMRGVKYCHVKAVTCDEQYILGRMTGFIVTSVTICLNYNQ
jgi:hypothetical protein